MLPSGTPIAGDAVRAQRFTGSVDLPPTRLTVAMLLPRATDPVPTERLLLTPIGLGDVDDLWRLYSDPLVARWTGPWSYDGVEAWARDMASRWLTDGVGKWLARDRSDGALVGRGGLSRMDLAGEAVLEVGWVVRDALAGRGFGTEIGRAALDWASTFFPALPVIAFTEVHNRASRAVMHHLDLRFEGIIHREGLVEGRDGLHPDAAFALYRRVP